MKNLSFVIQGPNLDSIENKITSKLILSIRKFFPESTVIFSTWENEITQTLPPIDKIIYNSDPGGFVYHKELNLLNNVNRQIVSTINGLIQVETEYAIKVRSDLIFINPKIINNLSNLNLVGGNNRFKLLSEHVLVSNQTSVNPRKRLIYPFHLCDWILAGKTKDLIRIWDIPLMPNSAFNYFNIQNGMNPYGNGYSSRYLPESYIISSFVGKYIDLIFSNSYDYENNNILISEYIVANNFIIKSNLQMGVKSQKYNKKLRTLLPMYTYHSWKKLAVKNGISNFDRQFDVLSFLLPIIGVFKIYFVIAGKLKKLLG
jgi:hypothetical protein